MKLEKDIKDDKFKESLDQTIMYHSTLHKVDRVINQIPSIIFIGQTKSGKSSLINEILEATVVAVDQRPCTARLVQLEYTPDDKPCVMIVDKDGNIKEKRMLTKRYIPSEWINLPHEQRQKEEIITQKVIAQVKNPFLESGVQIIDSPGQDENPLLDKLVMGHLETILPLIVYVIDGRNLVTVKVNTVDIVHPCMYSMDGIIIIMN
jgi:ribosome biogenesis GTPase A